MKIDFQRLLPPTASLKALESASRHLSYTRAAEELFLTQSAISHQIKQAEEFWGVKLFNKKGRRVVLSPAGEAIAPMVREFLLQLSDLLRELRNEKEEYSLKLSMLRSFASKWLSPRLDRLNKLHPELDIWISASEEIVDLHDSDIDIAIRLGHGNWPNLQSTLLFREYIFPVCSPKYLNKVPPPTKPVDLLRYQLLYRSVNDIAPRWRDWFEGVGVRVKSLPKGMMFSDTSMAIQAAEDGLGIALARSAHVSDDLKLGRLVRVLNQSIPSKVAYYLVHQKDRINHMPTLNFSNWLINEARLSQSEFDETAYTASTNISSDNGDDSLNYFKPHQFGHRPIG